MHNVPEVEPLKAQKHKGCWVLSKGNSEITFPPNSCLSNEVKSTQDNWKIRKEKKKKKKVSL